MSLSGGFIERCAAGLLGELCLAGVELIIGELTSVRLRLADLRERICTPGLSAPCGDTAKRCALKPVCVELTCVARVAARLGHGGT